MAKSQGVKKFFKNRPTRVWFIVTSVLIAFMITAYVLMAGVFKDFFSITLGGQRIIGRTNGNKIYTASAKNKKEACANGNKLNEEICEEGFVLLKNENDTLPLTKKGKVSVFGKNSVNLVYGGSGSGGGNFNGAATIYGSLESAGFEVNPTLKSFYENNKKSGSGRPENPSIENNGKNNLTTGETPQSNYTDDIKESYTKYNDAAIVVLSRIGGEGFDLPYGQNGTEHYLKLDTNEKDLLNMVTEKFENVIVILNCSTSLEISELSKNPEIDSVIVIGGPGYSGINALGRIINGEVSPSGKTVDTWAADFTKNPTYVNFANGAKDGDAFYYTYTGDKKDDSGYYFVDYEEGIYVGYRYYESRGEQDEDWYDKNVVYPFGYGLSYTTFDWEIENISSLSAIEFTDYNKNQDIEIKVKVTNTGKVAGKDVVELYFDSPVGKIEKSATALVGFEKTKLLQPNDSETLTIKFNPYNAASYDYNDADKDNFKGYEIEKGEYKLSLKSDAHTLKNNVQPLTVKVNDTIHFTEDPTTGNKVENRFDDCDDQLDIIMSRTNFEGTFPTAATGRELTEDLKKLLDSKDSHRPEKEVSMPAMNKEVTKKLVEMNGLPYDDAGWNEILDCLTFDEMKALFNKAGYKTESIPKIGLGRGIMTDGPVGFTNFMSKVDVYDTVSYASEYVIGQTWSKELAEKFGASVGEEAIIGKQNEKPYTPYSGWYAPAINLHRSPFGGRSFEYFSEDPVISGSLAAAEIRGASSKGLITFVKHFALNEQETHRDDNGVATWATEQAMRELYLKAFEIAVKDGKSMGLMSSFNRIGTTWAGGDYRLLTEVLRDEWGFEGAVVSDFNTSMYMNSKQMVYAGGNLNLTTTRPWKGAKTDNAEDVTVLREAAHGSLYALANSNAMNGITPKTTFRVAMPVWQVWLIVIEIIVTLGLIGWGVAVIILFAKKNKKGEISQTEVILNSDEPADDNSETTI